MAEFKVQHKTDAAIKYARQAEKLSLSPPDQVDDDAVATTAVEAKFITPLDNVVETANGERLPGVPPMEAAKFNVLKNKMEGVEPATGMDELVHVPMSEEQQEAVLVEDQLDDDIEGQNSEQRSQNLSSTQPPSRTHPLFPPLPLYGPPTFFRNLQCKAFQSTSFFLSLSFLGVIVLGSVFTSIPSVCRYVWLRLTFRDPDADRPFYEEEKRLNEKRAQAEQDWNKKHNRRRGWSTSSHTPLDNGGPSNGSSYVEDYEPTAGGKDPIVCDVSYYARRVGLDIETFKVQTEDGFIITLWHVFNPKEYEPGPPESRAPRRPTVFEQDQQKAEAQPAEGNRRYPVLLIHGLLQSAGAYCTNDDRSLAFYLAKSGYDVWLGNNRCGFEPEHSMLEYDDPRMWAWNIRQMGVMDLPALVSRVLSETGFEKLGLICHSQGTTETFVALAKEQRPDLGEKISVFCALAPAVYAGPLIGKMYFKFMRIISPAMFRVFFGIHAFIPFMMTMHRILPGRIYGALGYRVFSFLFDWTDERWDRGLRDRMFQFAPVYVSAESMRWWLGRECFAKQKCILATRDEEMLEDVEDAAAMNDADVNSEVLNLDQRVRANTGFNQEKGTRSRRNGKQRLQENSSSHLQVVSSSDSTDSSRERSLTPSRRGVRAWYSPQCPPMAFWIAGNDDLVDGYKLLRRFERGREPNVRVVHTKVIPEYEHLDVIWAMDCIEKVGREVKEVIWKTAPRAARAVCRTPKNCDGIQDFLD